MLVIDTWSSVQMRSFIVRKLWAYGELQSVSFDDLYEMCDGDNRSTDWLRRFVKVWLEQVEPTYAL
jgi:hypothetical protein